MTKKKRMLIEAVFPFGISRIRLHQEIAEQALEGLTELASLTQRIVFEVMDCATPVRITVSSKPQRDLDTLRLANPSALHGTTNSLS